VDHPDHHRSAVLLRREYRQLRVQQLLLRMQQLRL